MRDASFGRIGGRYILYFVINFFATAATHALPKLHTSHCVPCKGVLSPSGHCVVPHAAYHLCTACLVQRWNSSEVSQLLPRSFIDCLAVVQCRSKCAVCHHGSFCSLCHKMHEPALPASLTLQPRRISATAVASRIASERGEKVGKTVGYSIRLESCRSADTRLLLCTTGGLVEREGYEFKAV